MNDLCEVAQCAAWMGGAAFLFVYQRVLDVEINGDRSLLTLAD